jgi:polyferredoxin
MKKRNPKRDPHLVALRAIRGDGHHYVKLRRVTLAITVVILYAIPLSGMARLDLVAGHHRAAFAPVGSWLAAIGAMLVTALCFWAVTVFLRAVLGRVFCGFGCLVGQSARLGDNTATAEASKKRRWQAWAAQVGTSALFAGGVVAWWADLTLLWHGTVPQALAVLGLWLVGVAAAVLHGRYWRWGFCRQLCPIGLYYSVVGSGAPPFGVQFEASKCTDCGLCDKVCPVRLEPRDLGKVVDDAGGLSFDFLPGADHCLVCGDCVRACSVALKKKDYDVPALRLRLKPRGEAEAPASDSDRAVA